MRQAEERADEESQHGRLPAHEGPDHAHERDIAQAHRLLAKHEAGRHADELRQPRADDQAQETREEALQMGRPRPTEPAGYRARSSP